MSGFRHDIAGGNGDLVIDSVQSPNYVPGQSGWQIAQDGDAQFNSVELTGTFETVDDNGVTLAGIDPNGNITGQTISATTDVLINGDSVSAELSNGPQGILQRAYIPYASIPYPATGVTTTETVLYNIQADLLANRSYTFLIENVRLSFSATGMALVRLRMTTDGSSAGTSSDPFMTCTVACTDTAEGGSLNAQRTFQPTADMTINAALTLVTDGANCKVVGTSSSADLQAGQCAVTIDDRGYPATPNAWIPPGSGPSGTFTSYYTPAQTYSYNGDGTLRQNTPVFVNEEPGNPGGHGVQYAYLDFTGVSLPAGATINWMMLTLTNQTSYNSTGSRLALYMASTLNNHATFGNGGNQVDNWTISKGQRLGHKLAAAALTTWAAGNQWLIMGTNPWSTGNVAYYGQYSGGTAPVLTINYTI